MRCFCQDEVIVCVHASVSERSHIQTGKYERIQEWWEATREHKVLITNGKELGSAETDQGKRRRRNRGEKKEEEAIWKNLVPVIQSGHRDRKLENIT